MAGNLEDYHYRSPVTEEDTNSFNSLPVTGELTISPLTAMEEVGVTPPIQETIFTINPDSRHTFGQPLIVHVISSQTTVSLPNEIILNAADNAIKNAEGLNTDQLQEGLLVHGVSPKQSSFLMERVRGGQKEMIKRQLEELTSVLPKGRVTQEQSNALKSRVHAERAYLLVGIKFGEDYMHSAVLRKDVPEIYILPYLPLQAIPKKRKRKRRGKIENKRVGSSLLPTTRPLFLEESTIHEDEGPDDLPGWNLRRDITLP
ncbi:MAG TPA: hypothetical protein VLF89_01955 [Candidatus Saccharimonadales bacterium]|nr:hypothetical protein [Candidatus Saccharimonadales bacterium]